MNTTGSHNTNTTLIKNIHDFLQNGDKQIKYSPNKEIVLLLGNTGSGKSTLTHYISGNDHMLQSKEVEEGTGQFVIVDNKNKISSTSTIVSQTIYPELVEDGKTKTVYYDCPGFSDTRSAAHEIAATYFIKRVIDSARSVKMVFVVTHNSVSKGEDRQHFILMLQHATDFMKEIEKFKNSIALIVTKIENRYVGGRLVSDEKVINAIGKFLEQAKRDISENPEILSASPGNNSNIREKVLSLFDIFLKRGENGKYTRIGIFRKPDQSGLLSNITLMTEGKISLQTIINKNIQFVESNDKDFGYTVSAKSKVHISGLAEEINKTILKELDNMGEEVKAFCIAQEDKTYELKYLNFIFTKIQESFSKIQADAINNSITPEIFINQFDQNIKNYNISIPDHHIKTLQRESNYIKFLNLVSNQSITSYKSSLLAAGLSNLVEYLSDTQSFYGVLNNVYQRLSQFDIQANKNIYSRIQINELKDLFKSPVFEKIKEFFKAGDDAGKMKLDNPKLKLLKKVLDETLKNQIEFSSPEIDKIVVKGVNVKLSDLVEPLRDPTVKFIEVYALHKVFIDTSLDLTGREIQMAIIAPVWEVKGIQSIILDGEAGMDYSHKARSGRNYGESGSDGQPGKPGGPAGSLIGIGEHYVNAEYLRISANGGKGGRGQDGGDGSNGFDGDNCPSDCTENDGALITVFYNKEDQKFVGGKGGNGGDGGIGGYGGHRGRVLLYKVGTEPGVIRANLTAQDGSPGENGRGGILGKGGRYYLNKVRNYVLIVTTQSFEPMNKWAKDGVWGNDGTNLRFREDTWQLTKQINLNYIKTEYKSYLLKNIKNNLQESFLTKFFGEIDNSRSIDTQLMNRKRRNVMNTVNTISPEEQFRKPNNEEHIAIAADSQSYDHIVSERKDNYYWQLFHNLVGNGKPVSRNIFLERESIKQNPSMFPIPMQLENMKTEKDLNINDGYSSINLHGNLLLSEMLVKKFIGKETSSHHDYEGSSEEGVGSAHDLAYRYYLRK